MLSSTFKRRCERLHNNTHAYATPPVPLAPPLSTMLDIGDVFARFIEDKISGTRVIARVADLYGERSRHWSTAEPISILIWLALTWLALSLSEHHLLAR